ncbi:MAG: acyl-CoA dehydratase activase, partial [Candidatus Bathyarchaeia archaeon]
KGLTLGVDSGSSWTKVVVMRNGEIVGYSWVPTTDTLTSAETAVKEALANAQVAHSQLTGIGVTGYGRFILSKHFHANVSMEEISVCAKGATYLAGLETGDATVLDIGGNDNKAITVHGGFPDSFTVGGICAGASGRFLEVVARRIGVDIKDFGDVALKGDRSRISMNAYCIVFGIQDLVSSLAMGQTAEDVAAAACRSVAEQFFQQQLQELDLRQPVVQVGGTALNVGLVKAIEEVTKTRVVIPDYPQYAGAVGAAVLASAATRGDG